MIVKVITRIGTASSRCIRRAASLSVVNPNVGWKAFAEQAPKTRSFTVLAAPSNFNNKFCTISDPLLCAVDPATSTTRTVQTKGDKDLTEFLEDEISAEKKTKSSLPDMSPFTATFNDAEVVLTRKMNQEVIIIKFNINNSVDTQDPEDPADGKEAEPVQMFSRPNFSVEIERKGQVISLGCSFSDDMAEEAAQDDVFTINDLAVYEGDFSDETYSTSGDILDGYLYDLLMNMLAERGIDKEFVDKISQFSTTYEHQRYVGLLENLMKFFK